MSAFIVVVVVGACTWVVFRAATQPVEPATAGSGPTRAPAPRRTRPPKPRPPSRPVPPVAEPPPVLAPPPVLPAPEPPAPIVLAPPVLPPPVLPPPAVEVPEDDQEDLDEPDDVEELDELATAAPPRRRTGPRSDPGEPARPPTFVERVRSAALLVVLAVLLGGAVALAIGIGMLVLFNLLRGAVG